MTIWISREPPIFNFDHLYISWASIVHPSQNFWRPELDQSFCVQFVASRYIMGVNRTPTSKVMAVWIRVELPCYISSISIYYVPESDIRANSYDPLNFSRTSIFQFRVSRYIIGLNRTPMSKVMAIWIRPDLPVQFRVSRYIMCLNLTSEWKFFNI